MKDKEKLKRSVSLGEASAVGIEIVAAIVIGALGGAWLDKKFGTEPYLTLFGIAAGFGAAAKAVMRVIKRFNAEEKNENADRTDDKKMGD